MKLVNSCGCLEGVTRPSGSFDPDDLFMNLTRFIKKSFASQYTFPCLHIFGDIQEKHSFGYDVFDKRRDLLKISRIFLLPALKNNGIKR